MHYIFMLSLNPAHLRFRVATLKCSSHMWLVATVLDDAVYGT